MSKIPERPRRNRWASGVPLKVPERRTEVDTPCRRELCSSWVERTMLKTCTRFLIVISIAFISFSCGGGDKHLPSLNPPEYDPKKDYTSPSVSQPTAKPARSAVSEEPSFALPSLEPGPDEKGEWRKVPMKPRSFQQLQGPKNVCDALSQLVQGLGSAQLFAGVEGEALKKSLGSQAESIARSLDQQLFDTFAQQLGPNATCPSLIPTRKSSSFQDSTEPVKIVHTNGQAHGFIQLAQATVPEGDREGYEMRKGSTKFDISPDHVGQKTREWRTEVGSKPETAGSRNSFVLINGGKVRKCPTPEGVVEGDYEFALVVHQTTNDGGTVKTLYNARRIFASLKGLVGDDAKLQYVDLDATLAIGRGGTDTPTLWSRQRQHVRFVPDRQAAGLPSQFSNWSISEWSSELVGATESNAIGMLLLAVTVFSGPMYVDAEVAWSHENTCVEVTFTPVTKIHKLSPNESAAVKTELRTKKEQAVVSAKFKEAKERPREGNGNVSPRQAESQPVAPATFTYKAPATRVRHSGFRVGVVSRAGVAEGEWEVAEGAYILEFQSRIVDREPTAPAESVATGNVTLTLVEGKDMYRGSGLLGYQTGPPPNRDPCTSLIMGHGTTRLDVAGMFIRLSERTGTDGSQVASADIELHYLIHLTNEMERLYTMVNYQCVPGELVPHPFFYSLYAVSRGAEEINLLKGWTYVGRNGVVATKALHGTCGDLCEDVTVFTLKEMNEEAFSRDSPSLGFQGCSCMSDAGLGAI
jgi:hypothetical protein